MSFKKPNKEDADYLMAHGVLEDPDFNADYNKMVIEGTIRKAEEKRKAVNKIYNEQIADRADALATFFKHVNNGKNNNVENYFGRKELARLRGEEIATQLKGRVQAVRNAKKN